MTTRTIEIDHEDGSLGNHSYQLVVEPFHEGLEPDPTAATFSLEEGLKSLCPTARNGVDRYLQDREELKFTDCVERGLVEKIEARAAQLGGCFTLIELTNRKS